ncbi:RNA polymerase I-specific transcription initiation factor RRN3 [Paramuricea clavata]|uniref:RNA polymerase I-specific transcription initiation factor RRN3 n=1 Tax=Paramuricea clavata TaxID=317549 RepID=A0A7D9DCR2_PARCT|nr:RNA polymerase I-specific transcription initiation factor RRN3 [Paramuricea clavata]
MSKDTENETSQQDKGNLRGEVLLSGFIKKALLAFTQGKTKDYDSLVQKLIICKDKPADMRKYLHGLKNCISSLTKEYDTLVGAALSLPWSDKEDETVDEFVDFLMNLVSSQTYYLHACLKMLIKNFSPYVKKGSTLEEIDLDEQQKRFQNTHKALQVVVEIVPTAPAYLLPVIVQGYLYLKRSVTHHEFYVKNLLELSEYVPSLHEDILEVICSHFLKIDVEIPKQELENAQDDITQFDVELEPDSDEETTKTEDEEKTEKMQNEMAEKLDILMNMVFEYIKKACYNEEKYNLDSASDLFDKLLEVFLKVVFPTHDSCHVQFLIFYICSFDQIFVNKFLEVCWTKFQDPNTPLILRQIAAAYIGSLVARANYITLSVVQTCLELLVNWIHGYIDEFDSTSGKPDVNKHGHFYSLCQAIFYIFVFCHPQLLGHKDGIKFVRRLNFERIVTCKLNPLKVCLSTVVKMFALVTRTNEVVFCYTIIEKNNRSILPVASSSFSSSVAKLSLLNQLDSFFPFDPYFLKRSRKCIVDIYREWEDLEPDHDEDEENDDYLDLGKTPESLPMTSLNSLSGMSISPGFTKT